MSGSLRGDHFREDAKRVRALAQRMPSRDLREQMEQLARQYEELAGMADRIEEHRRALREDVSLN
jgi:hypothetical protein